ncbi:hypothetical protein Lal_00043869 [Lupinus albus]|uniref:Putative pentatricopeptide n=1 Tax=Lupinus albus TaxID=3870 RepID=A0A6A5PCU7_LUPAL|nr:putative pentatricopeptide [Lupinus albus]KAF1895224.1 hypothetical protein Lal_00043869 [Lupinus albus]
MTLLKRHRFHSFLTFLRQPYSLPRINPITQFRNFTSDIQTPDAKDPNFVKEICRITRTVPRWENTLLSQYPNFHFSDPSFFLLYLNHQNNAFLSLRFFHWLCSISGFSPDQSSCNALFKTLVDAGACKAAKSLLDFPGFTPQNDSLECYISCLSSSGMVEDALMVFVKLKKVGFCPSVDTWNEALLGCLKSGRIDLVWTLYEHMMESGVVANIDVQTVGYLIKAFCAENNVSKGYELLREVLDNGLCPDNSVFNVLIGGFCKERQYARVSELLHTMIEKKCKPDIFTYQEIINGLMKWKNPEGLRVFKDLKDRGYFPDRVVYTTMIKGLFKMGRLGEARKLWFEMIQKGILPNEYTYNVMIHGHCQIGDLVQARKLYKEMCGRGYKETAVSYSIMISGLCLCGKTSEALRLFEEMPQKGIVRDLVTYNCLIKGLCENAELVEAKKLFNELLAQGLEPSVFSFTPLIERHCKVGDAQEAIRLWKDMHDRHLEPISSTNDHIIIGLCKEGNSAQAMEWLLNMLSWKLKPLERTFERLIHSLSLEDKLDEILVVLDLMFRTGYRLDENLTLSLVSKFSKENFHFADLCLEKVLERN